MCMMDDVTDGNKSGQSRVGHLAIVTMDGDADGLYTILY